MFHSPLRDRVQTAFEQHLGGAPSAWVQAPGRVNLIGEHTDYNDGFVLPCAIDYHTLIAARPRGDRQVRVLACDMDDAPDTFSLDDAIVPRTDALWANYVRGMVKLLQQAGHRLSGMDLAIAGNVPQGAGLSSSASLEVAVGHAFKQLCVPELAATALARLAQRAENEFVGCNCGIMDQLISACGQAGHALLIDCRSLEVQPVPLPAGVAVLIVHSRVKRGLVESEYNTRRAQCEAAARHYQVPALRDLDLARLQAGAHGLDATVLRRARHIVTENQRTLDAAHALASGDLIRLGALMAQSHASMRDDFDITMPAIDQLVVIAQQAIGTEGGARMTGGGFGGCIVAVLPEARVAAAREAIELQYRSPEGAPAHIYVCHASAGAGAA
jgi:galactokinase